MIVNKMITPPTQTLTPITTSGLTDAVHHSQLLIPSHQGDPITVPLPGQLRPSDSPTQAINNCLVVVKPCWYISPPPEVDRNYLRDDLLRLDDWLRQLIHHQLHAQPDALDTWYQHISEQQRQLVDQCFDPINSPRLTQGWLYLFLEGKLWREIFVDNNGQLCEIDLSQEIGKPLRTASGIATDSLTLPYSANGQTLALTTAFSDVQWSWPRINYYGGMAHHDPRLTNQPKHVFPKPSETPAQFTKRQHQRLASIDLSSCIHGNQLSPDTPSSALQTRVIEARGTSPTLLLIPNPMGFLHRLQRDLSTLWQHFINELDSLPNRPFFDCAITAYPLFYGASAQLPPSPAKNNCIHPAGNVFAVPTAHGHCSTQPSNRVALAAKHMDKSIIENILGTQSRQRHRRWIRQRQQQLLACLSSDSLMRSGLSFNTLMMDFFAANEVDYELAFSTLQQLLEVLLLDPSRLDNNLDLTSDAPPSQHNAGVQYIRQLCQNHHPLFPALFPVESDIGDLRSPSTQESIAESTIPEDENDGSGRFRLKNFQQLYLASKNQCYTLTVETHTHHETNLSHSATNTITLKAHGAFKQAIDSLIIDLANQPTAQSQVTAPTTDSTIPVHLWASVALLRASGQFGDVYLTQGIHSSSAAHSSSTHYPGLDDIINDTTDKSHLQALPADAIPLSHVGNGATPTYIASPNNPGLMPTTPSPYERSTLHQHIRKRWLLATTSTIANKSLFHTTHGSVEFIFLFISSYNLRQAFDELVYHPQQRHLRNEFDVMNKLLNLTNATFELIDILLKKETPSKTSSYVSHFSHLLNVFMLIDVIFTGKDIKAHLHNRDYASATGQGMAVSGYLLRRWSVRQLAFCKSALSHIERTVITDELTALTIDAAFWSVAGWVAMTLALSGIALQMLFADDRLTTWAKHGPFSKYPQLRLTGQYHYWQYGRGPAFAYQALLNIIVSPRISYLGIAPGEDSSQPRFYLAEITLPQFTAGEDQLELHGKWAYVRQPLNPSANAMRFLIPARVSKIIQIDPSNEAPVTKMHYYFPILTQQEHPLSVNLQEAQPSVSTLTLSIQTRLICHHGEFILPCGELPTAAANINHHFRASDAMGAEKPGWCYGEVVIDYLAPHYRKKTDLRDGDP